MNLVKLTPLLPISNGLAPTPSAPKPPKPKAASNVADFRTCSACRKPLPESYGFKWCERCRLKDREKAARKRDRDRRQPMGDFRTTTTQSRDEPSALKKQRTAPAANTTAPARGKVGQFLAQIPRERVQLGKRKAADVDRDGGDVQDDFVHFQTASKLYDALSSTLKEYYDACLSASTPPPYIRFHGMHSIVANPKIVQWKRVELVSTDVRKVVKLPHSNKQYHDDAMSTKKWTETFQCDCSRGRVRTPSSSQTPPSSSPISHPAPPGTQPSQQPSSSVITPAKAAPLKRTQSSLSHWILNSNAKSSPAASTPGSSGLGSGLEGASSVVDSVPGCGGMVHISAEEDDTHPLAHLFKGQKIVVVVEHPPAK